jgi:hypothetical protein
MCQDPKEDDMRKLSITLCVCFAATLAAARPAAAQPAAAPKCTPTDHTIQVILQGGVVQTKREYSVKKNDCVCWVSNAQTDFKIWFPLGGPLSTDTLVVEGHPSRVCDRAIKVGYWYYKASIDGTEIPDPWLDVGT